MIDYAEVTLETPADGERLHEMTANGWRIVTKATRQGVVTYYLERAPIVGPHEDKEHSAHSGRGYR
ncbi:MAG: hypothetical protein WC565_10570 [Parcubacteria group bacterium]